MKSLYSYPCLLDVHQTYTMAALLLSSMHQALCRQLGEVNYVRNQLSYNMGAVFQKASGYFVQTSRFVPLFMSKTIC